MTDAQFIASVIIFLFIVWSLFGWLWYDLITLNCILNRKQCIFAVFVGGPAVWFMVLILQPLDKLFRMIIKFFEDD